METKLAQKRKQKRKNKIRIRLIILANGILIILAFLLLECSVTFSEIYDDITIEAGTTELTLDDFYKEGKTPKEHVKIASDLEEAIDFNVPGDYEVTLRYLFAWKKVNVTVMDTTSPVVETQDVTTYVNARNVFPEDFVSQIEDATKTTVTYMTNPDFSVEGQQEVSLVVTDEGGNVTVANALLTLYADVTPPVISGVEDMTVKVGENISYKKNVTVTDDFDQNVTLYVDSSNVNIMEVGDYEVFYKAVDSAGNETIASAKVFVRDESMVEDLIESLAAEILVNITTEDMSDYDKAYAIFRYVHDEITYTNSAEKESELMGAYQGLVQHKGDCFTYAMTAKTLLDQAGIENMVIEKIPTDTVHFWNLVDLGEGWYHFDATPRRDGTEIFNWSDAQLKTYSDANNNSHKYDSDVYDEIQ